MKYFFSTLIFCLISALCASQSTNISGTINTATKVIEISGDTITMVSSVGFSLGDQILIIQMQGSAIDESNTASFGDITSMNSTGNYEFRTICTVLNGTQLVVNGIERTYEPSGIVQAVHVPVYNDAVITAVLTASPWNGSTGGVLAFECTGTLTLNDNIDLQGLGFRGGGVTTSSYSCSWLIDPTDYFYNISTGEGAMKGEGLALYIPGKTGGRGAQASGGGGANDHNGGGGGGSNAASGGLGGERIKKSTFTCSSTSPGVGGKLNPYTNTLNKLFLGGGGGAGHENNPGTATAGRNGGGIVLLKAAVLIGNGNSINVDGASNLVHSSDGAGGGGGGGSVLLDVPTFSGALIVNANGSDGGNVSNVGSSNCNGPGGGGSGGVLWISQSSIPLGISPNITGGAAGITAATTQTNCTLGGNNNATDGNTGLVLTGLSSFEANCNISTTIQSTTICNSDSMYLSGAWQLSAGTFYDTISSGCCDRIIETTLTVLPEISDTINQTICAGEQVVLNGTIYNATITGAIEIFNAVGPNNCDSTVLLNLTVLNAIDTSISISGNTLTANQTGANYQWVDCNNVNLAIDGATAAQYTFTDFGTYAVVITTGACSDTSACYTVNTIGILENNFEHQLRLYPNPTSGKFAIDLGKRYPTVTIKITDLAGKLIHSQHSTESQLLHLKIEKPAGLYLLMLESGDQKAVIRLVKE